MSGCELLAGYLLPGECFDGCWYFLPKGVLFALFGGLYALLCLLPKFVQLWRLIKSLFEQYFKLGLPDILVAKNTQKFLANIFLYHFIGFLLLLINSFPLLKGVQSLLILLFLGDPKEMLIELPKLLEDCSSSLIIFVVMGDFNG